MTTETRQNVIELPNKRAEAAQQFIDGLFATSGADFVVLGTKTPTGKGGGVRGKLVPLAEAGRQAVALSEAQTVYFHVCNHDRAAVEQKIRRGGRCSDDTARSIPALWLDIDINAKTKKPGFMDPAEAVAVLRTLTDILEPSAVIYSGSGGYHVYWFLDTPLDARKWAKLPADWIEAIRKGTGHRFDSVGDLARIMRIPGTVHHGAGAIVETGRLESGRRYTVTDVYKAINALEQKAAIPVSPSITGGLGLTGGDSLSDLGLSDSVNVNTDAGSGDSVAALIDFPTSGWKTGLSLDEPGSESLSLLRQKENFSSARSWERVEGNRNAVAVDPVTAKPSELPLVRRLELDKELSIYTINQILRMADRPQLSGNQPSRLRSGGSVTVNCFLNGPDIKPSAGFATGSGGAIIYNTWAVDGERRSYPLAELFGLLRHERYSRSDKEKKFAAGEIKKNTRRLSAAQLFAFQMRLALDKKMIEPVAIKWRDLDRTFANSDKWVYTIFQDLINARWQSEHGVPVPFTARFVRSFFSTRDRGEPPALDTIAEAINRLVKKHKVIQYAAGPCHVCGAQGWLWHNSDKGKTNGGWLCGDHEPDKKKAARRGCNLLYFPAGTRTKEYIPNNTNGGDNAEN